MKVSSGIEKRLESGAEADRPAPYNWIMILVIFIAYLVLAFLV